jgi:alkylated DNA repair protein alkB homolog 8
MPNKTFKLDFSWFWCHFQSMKKKRFLLETISKLEKINLDELVSAEPSDWLIVLNCSFDSMVDGPTLEAIFSPYKGFQRVEMFYGAKGYSYVQFKDPECGRTVMEQLDGFKSSLVNKIILLAYAKKLPIFPPKPIKDPKSVTVPGLELVLDFVTPTTQDELIASVIQQGEKGRWEFLNRRAVQHYGYKFDYPLNDIRRVSVDEKLPTWCESILKAYQALYPSNPLPNQLTMNRYMPGDGIAYHTDRHSSFEGPILIISLGSDIVMDFKSISGDVVSVVLFTGSLLVMKDEARYGWQHVIRPRKVDLIDGKISQRRCRWSLTFRTLRRSSCVCNFKQLCD